jgi:D-glycero-D-manno-heptose 1,7-bisphosphate phosphatase
MRGPIRISDLPFNSEEIWCEVLTMASHRRAALFLDRDGVVVEDKEYLWRKEDIVMIPGAAGAIAAANNCGIAVVQTRR